MNIQGDGVIGEWTVSQLIQFLSAQRDENPPVRADTFTCDDLIAVETAKFYDRPQFYQYQNTVGSAGSAAALPANPLAYFKVLDRNGTTVLIPYYNA